MRFGRASAAGRALSSVDGAVWNVRRSDQRAVSVKTPAAGGPFYLPAGAAGTLRDLHPGMKLAATFA